MKPVSTYHVGNSQIHGKTNNVWSMQLIKKKKKKKEWDCDGVTEQGCVMVLGLWVWKECDHFLLLWLHRSIVLKTHPPSLKMITGEEDQKSSDNPGRDNQQAHIRVIAYFEMT